VQASQGLAPFVGRPPELQAFAASSAEALEAMSSEGYVIRHVRSVVARADEMCFHLFEAASQEVVAELARRAELRYERIVEAEEHRSGRHPERTKISAAPRNRTTASGACAGPRHQRSVAIGARARQSERSQRCRSWTGE
jgi:hypothetical protein